MSIDKSIREANLDDAIFVYNLRFSDDVISNSWTSDKPSLDKHKDFFKKNFEQYHIILDDEKPIGFIRNNNEEISIALIPAFRNKSIASYTLKYFKGKATIKFKNIASLYAFINAGWKPVGWILNKSDK